MGCGGGNLDARIAACTQLIQRGSRESKSNRIRAYISRSDAYRAKADFDHALADLDKALRLDEKLTNALMERASIYHEKGEFERAIADYDKVIQLDPNLATAHGGRARAYRDRGDLDKALADFGEATRLDPKSAITYVDRGAIYEAKGDLDRAISDYDEAIKIDPRDANAYLGRGRAYKSNHDFTRARHDFEVALGLDQGLGAAKDALDDVNRLVAESSAPPPSAPSTSPGVFAVNPIYIMLLAMVALIGLVAIIAINVFAKPSEESPSSGAAKPFPSGGRRPTRDGYLAEVSRLQPGEACTKAGSSLEGLSQTEAEARLTKFGLNVVAREAKATILQELWSRARNPLNALLLSLATVSYFLGDVRAAVVIAFMVVLAITTAFIQEHKSNEAAARLCTLPQAFGAAQAMQTIHSRKSLSNSSCQETSYGSLRAT
jgi:tetratricopeptide (TPR) repeat protein